MSVGASNSGSIDLRERFPVARRSISWGQWGIVLLTLVPLAHLVIVVRNYAVPIPFWDQWAFVPAVGKLFSGELGWSDLWVQNNEHRLVFPKLIMFAIARLTRWDISYELALNIILGLGIFGLIAYQTIHTMRVLKVQAVRWAIPACSMVVLSVSQYENWLWGWQMCMFLNVLAVIAGVVLLSNGLFSWKRLWFAAMFGVVATYSFANGILFWPIGLVVLLMVMDRAKAKLASVLVWVGISLLSVACYFLGYHKISEHPPVTATLQMPIEYAAYVLKYVGSITAQFYLAGDPRNGPLALAAGALAIGTFVWAASVLLRQRLAPARALIPYLAIGAYTLGSALVTGLGRVGFGSNQALAPRYCTMAMPLWACLVVLLWLVARCKVEGLAPISTRHSSGRIETRTSFRTTALAVLVTFALLLGVGSVLAVERAKMMSRAQVYGCMRLLQLSATNGKQVDDEGLSALFADTRYVLNGYPILVKYKLSIFANEQIWPRKGDQEVSHQQASATADLVTPVH